MSSGARAGRPGSGSVRAMIVLQLSASPRPASGSSIIGSPAGTPGFWCAQVSSLPTNSSDDSLCSST